MSMLVKLCEANGIYPENVVMGVNYGFDKVRFLAPVKSGKRIRHWLASDRLLIAGKHKARLFGH